MTWEAWTSMSGGPERVVTDQPHPNPNYKPRPAGFTAKMTEPEPQLWEGDDS